MDRKTFVLLVLLPVSGLLLFCAGAACGYFVLAGGPGDPDRAAEYEAASDAAEGIAGDIGEGIEGAADGVRRAREAVAGGGDSVGRIREGLGIIGAESERIGGAADSVEEGILRIESILSDAGEAGESF